MCKANDNMMTKVTELLQLKGMLDELQQEINVLQDEIKEYMGEEETMTSGEHVVRYQYVVSQRCDTKALRELLGDALDPYMKQITSRRFTIN